jgi:hypothetical protein
MGHIYVRLGRWNFSGLKVSLDQEKPMPMDGVRTPMECEAHGRN